MTSALWESANVTECPGKVENVAFLPDGKVEIIYPVTFLKSEFRIMAMLGDTASKPFDPPRGGVYRKITLCPDHMKKWLICSNKQHMSDYVLSIQFNDIYRRNKHPKGLNLWCCQSVLPEGINLRHYKREEALELISPEGREPTIAEVCKMTVDYDRFGVTKQDTYEEYDRLHTLFKDDLEKAMFSSEFIFRKDMRHKRPKNADPLVTPSEHHEYYINDYLVKLQDGGWARFSLPARKGIPAESRPKTIALTPLTVLADAVLLPVEIIFGALAAWSISGAIPH